MDAVASRHRRAVAVFACLTALGVGRGASADDWDRHPQHASPLVKPAGVPSDYVITRNGFFHPSCVVALRSDEAWGRDLVIRGLDGVEHDRITPCAFPRYSLTGRPIGGDPPSSGRAPGRATGSGLSTEWIVPLPPTNVGDQGLAFFNDIETQDIILQPVLDFSEIPGHWAIESENCCVQNNDVQSTLVEVTAGDTKGDRRTNESGTAGDIRSEHAFRHLPSRALRPRGAFEILLSETGKGRPAPGEVQIEVGG